MRPSSHEPFRLAAVCGALSIGLIVGLGCSSSGPGAGIAVANGAESKIMIFTGMCDASGAVPLEKGRFAVADDEDNILRIYDAAKGGAPLSAVDLSGSLALEARKAFKSEVARTGAKIKAAKEAPAKKKKAPKSPETDIEAATGTPDYAFWLTSHGRDSTGNLQPSRFRFFATTLPGPDGKVTQVGTPYSGLLADMLLAPQLAQYHLEDAAALSPKEPGGLNLEGMTAAPDGKSVIIGFRSPVVEGKALAVWLMNPLEVVLSGARASFDDVVQLDLGGLGIRSISWWRGRYLVIGGSSGVEPRASRLFAWDGKEERPRVIPSAHFEGLNPEAFASFEDREELLVLSDDGAVEVDGGECKRLKDPERKQFRGVWVRIGG